MEHIVPIDFFSILLPIQSPSPRYPLWWCSLAGDACSCHEAILYIRLCLASDILNFSILQPDAWLCIVNIRSFRIKYRMRRHLSTTNDLQNGRNAIHNLRAKYETVFESYEENKAKSLGFTPLKGREKGLNKLGCKNPV